MKNRLRACVLFIALFSFVSRPSQVQACVVVSAISVAAATVVLAIPLIVVSSLKTYDCPGDNYPFCCNIGSNGEVSHCALASSAGESCEDGETMRCKPLKTEDASDSNDDITVGEDVVVGKPSYVKDVQLGLGAFVAVGSLGTCLLTIFAAVSGCK